MNKTEELKSLAELKEDAEKAEKAEKDKAEEGDNSEAAETEVKEKKEEEADKNENEFFKDGNVIPVLPDLDFSAEIIYTIMNRFLNRSMVHDESKAGLLRQREHLPAQGRGPGPEAPGGHLRLRRAGRL